VAGCSELTLKYNAMDAPNATPDFSLAKLLAGALGSFVSLKFVQGTLFERVFMGVGGASVSYYAATPAYNWIGVPNTEGLVGFLIGLFGMAIMAKVYEVIQMTDAKQVSQDIWEWIKRKWGA